MSASQGASQNGKPGREKKRGLLVPVLVAVLIGAMVGAGGVWLALKYSERSGGAETSAKKPLYQCPMHPTITSDHPGDCPICGMKLVPVEPTAPEKNAAPGVRTIAFYRSPMDPRQTSPAPKKDKMGMDYLPVYEDELSGEGAPVPGLATITVDPQRQQIIGLRTAKVTRGPVGGSFRTVGTIAVDQRRVRVANLKVDGYVERISVNFTGQTVRRGQPLFSIFSPTLFEAENEYLLALQSIPALDGGTVGDNAASSLAAAARRKLELLDVPSAEIKRLERGGKAARRLTIYSPLSGVVTAKNVVQGSHLNPGDATYEITDLGEVWLLADAYESELARVKVGMTATLTLSAYPNRVYTGQVEFVDPLVNPQTRTAKVRLSFKNPTGELRPGLFGEVVIQAETRQALLIPFDAVLPSGTMNVVFVSLGQGKFQPREVLLGSRSGDQVEVTRGLAEGEEVVTRANFLIDSESRLRASLSALGEK